jgi:hypothetical protein
MEGIFLDLMERLSFHSINTTAGAMVYWYVAPLRGFDFHVNPHRSFCTYCFQSLSS